MNTINVSPGPLLASERELLPDALRGFALLGILLVNLMYFTSVGDSGPAAKYASAAEPADRIAYVLIAFFAESKFYPIFAFLFGYGFVLFWHRAQRRTKTPSTLFYRRVAFMAALGLLHGTLLWAGDILLYYAIVALCLHKRLAFGPRRLLRALRRWSVAAVCISMFGTLLISSLFFAGLLDDAWYGGANSTALYSSATFTAVTIRRTLDFIVLTLFSLLLLPQMMVFFLLGAFIARAGWLRHPDQHWRKWQHIFCFSAIVGVPLNVAWTALQVYAAQLPQWWFMAGSTLLHPLVFLQAGVVVAGFVILSQTRARSVLKLFGYAGRMPLSNYIFQSVVASTVLYGYGLGLGMQWQHAERAVFGIGLYLLQLAASYFYLQHFQRGPLESVWRWFTYRPQGIRKEMIASEAVPYVEQTSESITSTAYDRTTTEPHSPNKS